MWKTNHLSTPILFTHHGLNRHSNMNSLTVTPTMLANARDNKCVGWLYMNPLDFLRLTITNPNVFDWIRQEESDTKTLADYNGFASSGKSILMPWLDVDRHTGKVVGHEGRHRAIAVYVANGHKFPVAVCLRDHGYSIYYEQADTQPWKKTFMTKEDVPPVFTGQFVHREVAVHTKDMVEFWASHNR